MTESEEIVAQFSKRDKAKFWHKVDIRGPEECWPWLGSLTAGYGRFGRKGVTMSAHTVAHLLHGGALPEGCIVRHIVCRNPPCCNPAHLKEGTHKCNAGDREQHGMTARGATNGACRAKTAKLTPEKVREIRRLYEETHFSHKELGKQFGVSGSAIGFVLSRERWAHVK